MPTYSTTTGERIEKTVIDARIRKAKADKLADFLSEYGYYFCEECGRSSGRIDCSHDISVKEAQETGRTELAYDKNNITLRCRKCHNRHDNM